MRRTNLLLGAVAALAMSVGVSGAANAVTIIKTQTISATNLESSQQGDFVVKGALFDDFYNFTIPVVPHAASLGSISFDFTNTAAFTNATTNAYHKTGDIDFSLIKLTGVSLVYSQVGSFDNHLVSFVGVGGASGCAAGVTCYRRSYASLDADLAPGTYKLEVKGNSYGTYSATNTTMGGSYGGQVNWLAPEPVPEPASWALMMVGFGGLGAILRRRRSAMAFA